jgi:hypothetical protein
MIDGQIDALAAASLPPLPAQIVFVMLSNGQAAEDDIAEQMPSQTTRWRHHPAHAECCAQFRNMSRMCRARSHRFLQRDHVRVKTFQDSRRPGRKHTTIHAPTSVDVVRRNS